jgi:hypothetical protein
MFQRRPVAGYLQSAGDLVTAIVLQAVSADILTLLLSIADATRAR